MFTIGIVAGTIYAPGLLLGGGGWIASHLSGGARRWIVRQLFGSSR